MSQHAVILSHLKSKPITSYQAYIDHGITQLGARIFELRHEKGYNIEDAWVEKNDTRFKEYFMGTK